MLPSIDCPHLPFCLIAGSVYLSTTRILTFNPLIKTAEQRIICDNSKSFPLFRLAITSRVRPILALHTLIDNRMIVYGPIDIDIAIRDWYTGR